MGNLEQCSPFSSKELSKNDACLHVLSYQMKDEVNLNYLSYDRDMAIGVLRYEADVDSSRSVI